MILVSNELKRKWTKEPIKRKSRHMKIIYCDCYSRPVPLHAEEIYLIKRSGINIEKRHYYYNESYEHFLTRSIHRQQFPVLTTVANGFLRMGFPSPRSAFGCSSRSGVAGRLPSESSGAEVAVDALPEGARREMFQEGRI